MPPPKRVAVTLRFAPRTHAIIAAAAAQDGQLLSQWVREALLLRVGYIIGVQQGRIPQAPHPDELDAMRETVRAVLTEWHEEP